jgi:hypothetical protein
MKKVKTRKIDEKTNYLIHPHHRDGTLIKSQWIINESEEVECFKKSINNNWNYQNCCWGLYFENSKIAYLGLSAKNRKKIFIAKFINNDSNDWHGYPIDPQYNNADIPNTSVLNIWLTSDYLTAAKIRKISRGQSCSL